MLTKTYVAAVGKPERVDIGRERCIAWYARKINDMVSSRKTGGLDESGTVVSLTGRSKIVDQGRGPEITR
jgi:hypothetical protein